MGGLSVNKSKVELDLNQASDRSDLALFERYKGRKNVGMDGMYITFMIANEWYGISIKFIRQIIGYTRITNVPQSPDYVLGMINLRGDIIPVIDLKIKFAMQTDTDIENSSILVVELKESLIGILVDGLSNIEFVDEKMVSDPPYLGEKVDTSSVRAVVKSADRTIFLLDLYKVVDPDKLLRR